MIKNIFIAFSLFYNLLSNSLASNTVVVEQQEKEPYHSKTMGELVQTFYATTGIKALFEPKEGVKDSHGKDMSLFAQGYGRIIMILICFYCFI